MKKIQDVIAAILKGLGMDQAVIDTVVTLKDEDIPNFKPDDVIEKIKTGTKTALMNDNDFLASIPEDKIGKEIIKKVEGGQYARFQNELLSTATNQLGLDQKDLEDLTEEEKKSIKKTMVKIAGKYLSKKGNTEGLQQMQRDLQTATEALENSKTEKETAVTDAVTKTTKEFGTKIIKTLAKAELSQLSKIKLNVQPSYIVDPVLAKIGSKYDAVLVLGSDDSIQLKQNKNNALAVVGKDNKEITFAAALREVVLEDQLGVEEKEDGAETKRKKALIDSSGGGSGEAEPTDVVVPDYIKDKIEKNTTV